MNPEWYAPLGSISHGTMREKDLIPTFIAALDSIRERITMPAPVGEAPEVTRERVERSSALDDLLGRIEENSQVDGYFDSEECHWDLEALFDTLGDYAAPGCFFGSNEGDGSDYGFWEFDTMSDYEDEDAGVEITSADLDCEDKVFMISPEYLEGHDSTPHA